MHEILIISTKRDLISYFTSKNTFSLFKLGPAERNKNMGLLSNLRITLVPRRSLSQEAQVPWTVRRAVGEHGQPLAPTTHTTPPRSKRLRE